MTDQISAVYKNYYCLKINSDNNFMHKNANNNLTNMITSTNTQNINRKLVLHTEIINTLLSENNELFPLDNKKYNNERL
jgi:hypothetical protein